MADSFSHREKVPRGADEGTERSLMPWMEAACWGCRHGRMPATERHLAHASGLRSRTLTPIPAPRPGPRLRRGRSLAHAPMARQLCLLSPTGEGLRVTSS
ncbi:hypothetical protein XarbCFBP7697_06170 [Xanthomonas arboricola]|nr:hypothetical protein XarbCFBP7697_06170 [Xanthomonas arboricola]